MKKPLLCAFTIDIRAMFQYCSQHLARQLPYYHPVTRPPPRRGERDRALSEADSLREALSAIKDERRALLHDTGQFAHTHANVLKTLRQVPS